MFNVTRKFLGADLRGGRMTEREPYEAPELTEYGTIEDWTQGVRAQLIDLSVII